MLESLHIENIAIIRVLDVDFSNGFTVFTGETGAGKSIIIDSIGLLLGAKADRELIRNGEKSALVVATFTNLSSTHIGRIHPPLRLPGWFHHDHHRLFHCGF